MGADVPGTLLYIDDAPELPAGTAHELSRLGFRLLHVDDPEEGVRLAGEGVGQMVLLEILLPGGDGFEVLERLRSCRGAADDLPVLVLTRGERSPELYGRALELGASDFLSKPVLRAELLGAVLECAAQSEPERHVDPLASPVGAVDVLFSGDLADTPLPELLLRLRRIGANGVLVLQSDVETRAIELRNGSPMAAATGGGFESLEDFLVRTKTISGEEHEVVQGQARATGASVGEILVELGILCQAELQDAVVQRAAEPMLDAFGWSAGSFRFQKGKSIKSGQALEFDQSPGRLVLDGVLRWLSASGVRRLLDPRAAHFVSKVERPLYPLRDLGGAACDPSTLDGLAGDRTVAEVIESGEIDERMLYGLLVAGLVEVHPQPVLELTAALAVEEPEPAAPRRTRAAELPELEIDEEPGSELFDLDLDLEPEPEAEPVPGDPEADAASRRVEAESWFRQGEDFLVRKRYDKAVEAFGMASHLDPAQGEYRAHLGYALHLQQPRNDLVRREALEHIAKGIKLAPDRWKPLVFLARTFRAGGEVENARKVLRRALSLDPDCAAARAEMRLLQRARPEGEEGLLARVRGWLGRRR